ncbi:hypothetical protein J4772_07415 [Cohnella sp. LGH]|uniref:hypothetical protein n=1 Tax=Cohnella sp. LGH TaxID=1619153 RepID=UPI001ADBF6A6|nr:hypothetical protein [Cohnella sp. LGH]QTH44213.1 hypothetical protein J4772_07415 [Cohnella sp. LGH]
MMKIVMKIHLQKEQEAVKMMRHTYLEPAVLNVVFALRVKAASKAKAFESAMCQLSERNLCLDRIRLADEQGKTIWFSVERVEAIRWTAVVSTGFSHQFQVHGQIRLEIAPERSAATPLPLPPSGDYRFPGSRLSDKPIWVIPTVGEPAFAHVLNQTLERRLPCSTFSLTSAV